MSDPSEFARQLRPRQIDSLDFWTRWLQASCWLTVLALGVLVYQTTQGYFVSLRAFDGNTVGADLQASFSAVTYAGIAAGLASVAAGVLFLQWVACACANVEFIRGPCLRPTVAILLCLIPFAQFLTVPGVVSYLWRMSDPQDIWPSTGNKGSLDGSIVLIWWITVMAAWALVSVAGYMLLSANAPMEALVAAPVQVAAYILSMVQLGIFIWVVGGIAERQETLYSRYIT